MKSKVGPRQGWGWTIGGGLGLAVLASIPALDGVLWRAAARVAWAVAPWLLLLAAVVGLVVGLVALVRRWR